MAAATAVQLDLAAELAGSTAPVASPSRALPATTYRLVRVPTASLPLRLRYRGNVIVLVELVRDLAAPVPTWVLRARRATGLVSSRPEVCVPLAPLPTVSPFHLARAQSRQPHVILASSSFGRLDLERTLKSTGVHAPVGGPAERVMRALARAGWATSAARPLA